jgi:hypothetical protein
MVPRRRPYESEGFHRSCGAVEAPLTHAAASESLWCAYETLLWRAPG